MALTDMAIQPLDKTLPSYDYYGDIFDQYIDAEVFEFVGNLMEDQSSSEEFGNFFDFPGSLSGTDQTASPFPNPLQLGSCAKGTLSEPDLLNFDNLYASQNRISAPVTTPNPSSPITITPKRHSNTAISRRSISCGIRKNSRHHSLSPRMAQPTSTRHGRNESWAERIEAASQSFDYPSSSYQVASLPVSSTLRPSEWQNTEAFNVQSVGDADSWTAPQHFVQGSQPSYTQESYLSTPLTSPTFGHGHSEKFSPVQSPTPAYYMNPLLPFDGPYPLTSPRSEDAVSWEYDQETDCAFILPSYNDSTVQPWHPPNIQAHDHRYGSFDAPVAYTMIEDGRVVMQSNGLTAYNTPGMLTASSSYVMGSETLPSSPQAYTRQGSISSSNQHSRPKSRSRVVRSPSPIRQTARAQKSSRGHTRGKASNSASRHASVGFYNYTPDDHQKILNGVAKSGSANTKKKREQEQMDKQKKLAETAVQLMKEGTDDPEVIAKKLSSM